MAAKKTIKIPVKSAAPRGGARRGSEEREAPKGALPEIVERFRARFGDVWEAYEELAASTHKAGPLDERTQRLVKLGISIGARLEGATHSNAGKCLRAGIGKDELEHVAALAMSTLGLPTTMMAYRWVSEVIEREAKKSSRAPRRR